MARFRAIAAALLTGMLAAGCGSSSHPVARSTAPGTTPAQQPPKQAFTDYQDLKSGRTYTTLAFTPSLRFTVPRGKWGSEEGDMAQNFAVAAHNPGHGLFQTILAAHRVSRVYDPRRGGTTPGDQVALRGSFAAWLRHHPRLRILADRPTRLMGLDGSLLDVTGKSQPPKVPNECGKSGPDCAPLFYAGFDPVVYPRTSRGRFIVLNLPGGGELAIEEYVEPAGRFAKGLAVLRPLLAQLRLSG